MLILRKTTTWIISHWPPRMSTWRSPLSSFTHADERVLITLTSSLSQIPLLQRAQALSPRPLSLMASAWSAPAWMKTNGALIGKGSLKGQPGGKEHKTWAHYYIRWGCEGFIKIRSYFTSYYLTPGNLTFITSGSWKNMQNTIWAFGHWPQGTSLLQEGWQTTGLSSNYSVKHWLAPFLFTPQWDTALSVCSFQALGFTPQEQRDWVSLDLGPAVHASAFPNTHILILDDNRLLLPYWAKIVSPRTER